MFNQLAFDDHVARDDPFFNELTAEKLSNLYLQGNNFMIRLELERKEVARLNALIQSHEAILAQQKTKLYELAALDHNHAIMLGRVRKMEHDIDRRLVKMNEAQPQPPAARGDRRAPNGARSHGRYLHQDLH